MLPNAGPGPAPTRARADRPLGAHEIAAAAADGELAALYLLHVDPVREHADARAVATRARRAPSTVIAHASILTDALREHATVVFPAESYAEKEGTVTHPDGRVQRLRPAIGRPGAVRAEWQVLAELARACWRSCGSGLWTADRTASPLTGPMASAQLFDGRAVLRRADARGDRRARRALAGARGGRGRARPAPRGPFDARRPAAAPSPNGALRLGTFRSIWAAPEVEVSPALKFLARRAARSSSRPADAERLGLDERRPRRRRRPTAARVSATVALRGNVPAGHRLPRRRPDREDGATGCSDGAPQPRDASSAPRAEVTA